MKGLDDSLGRLRGLGSKPSPPENAPKDPSLHVQSCLSNCEKDGKNPFSQLGPKRLGEDDTALVFKEGQVLGVTLQPLPSAQPFPGPTSAPHLSLDVLTREPETSGRSSMTTQVPQGPAAPPPRFA